MRRAGNGQRQVRAGMQPFGVPAAPRRPPQGLLLGYRICRRSLAWRILWQSLLWLMAAQGIQRRGRLRAAESTEKEEIALRAQRVAASSSVFAVSSLLPPC